MQNRKHPAAALFAAIFAAIIVNVAHAGAREEGRLLTATEVLDEVRAMPDVRLPDTLLAHAYGIAVIPDVTKVAFIFGGRHGNGVLSVRDKLTSPWSNPVFISLTGGSWGFQAGAQSSDIILVFTTKTGIEGIAGGKLTLGADASVATGPVGRQGSAATDMNFNAEIYSYARTRGPFGEWRVLSQERRRRDRDLLGPGSGCAGDCTAIPRAPGQGNRNFTAQLTRSAGGRAGDRGTTERRAHR
jgi:lipid-binding SYLF domain-containing protein